MRPRPTGLWRHRDYLKLWGGQTVSSFGSQVTQLALPLTAVLTLRATPAQMGYLSALEFLPVIGISVLVGVWVDRQRSLTLLIAADVGRALLVAAVPALYLLHQLAMGELYVIALLAGCLTVLFDIGYLAYLPTLVGRDEIVQANRGLEISRATAEVAGPGLAGVLVQAWTAPVAMLVDGASFLASAASLLSIRRREPRPAEVVRRVAFLAEAGEGFRAVARSRVLRAIALESGTWNLFGNMVFTLLTLYAVRQLGFSPALLGAVLTVGSAGGLVGALLSAHIAQRVGLGPAICFAESAAGLGMLLIPLAGGPRPLAVALVGLGYLVLGFTSPVYSVNAVSLRQVVTPPELLGRMNATMRLVVGGTMPIGALIGGLLGMALGLRPTLLLGALGSVLASLWLYFSPVWRLQSLPTAAGDVGGSPAGHAGTI